MHKDGDDEVALNNRPASLLVAPSKVCDKVVLNQFTAYLTERNLLSNIIEMVIKKIIQLTHSGGDNMESLIELKLLNDYKARSRRA